MSRYIYISEEYYGLEGVPYFCYSNSFVTLWYGSEAFILMKFQAVSSSWHTRLLFIHPLQNFGHV
jgi:hypothetical protein